MNDQPVHLLAIGTVIVVVIAACVLLLTHHVVPTWFELIATTALGGALGLAVPSNVGRGPNP